MKVIVINILGWDRCSYYNWATISIKHSLQGKIVHGGYFMPAKKKAAKKKKH
jgi:hypothetical protein